MWQEIGAKHLKSAFTKINSTHSFFSRTSGNLLKRPLTFYRGGTERCGDLAKVSCRVTAGLGLTSPSGLGCLSFHHRGWKHRARSLIARGGGRQHKPL